MGRGFSKLQCAVLGLAYSVNKECNGGSFVLADGDIIPSGKSLNNLTRHDRFSKFDMLRGKYRFVHDYGRSGETYKYDSLATESLPDLNNKLALR